MERDEHFPAEILLDYIENRAAADTVAQVAAHLEGGCARCAQEIAAWQRLLGALHAYPASAPPEPVRQRALNIFEQSAAAHGSPAPSVFAPRPVSRVPGLAVILARLAFNSRVQPAQFGTRDAAPSFQLLFEADGTEIDLLCELQDTRWRVTGQALCGDTPHKGRLVSAASAQGRAETETDADGEFRLSNLPPGEYEIVLHEVDRDIVLPGVHLERGAR
jgi:hypothetical protein